MKEVKESSKKSVTERALATLVGRQYSLNELINSVHMKENRVVSKKNLTIVNDSTNYCPKEEITVTDGTVTVTEGRYVDAGKHDSQYHYIYLTCAEEDWKFKMLVGKQEVITSIREMYTATHIVEKLKPQFIGQLFNLTTVCSEIRCFLTELSWEEKGETQIDSVEGVAVFEDGREYNSMTFFVKAALEELSGIRISYDSTYIIRNVEVFAE